MLVFYIIMRKPEKSREIVAQIELRRLHTSVTFEPYILSFDFFLCRAGETAREYLEQVSRSKCNVTIGQGKINAALFHEAHYREGQ